jgi:hypothetical protein
MAKLKTVTMKNPDDPGQDITLAVIGPGGHPIYEIDGKEVEQDLAILRADLTRANGEAAERRHKLKEVEEKLALYDGLDPDKAKQALSVVSALDDKKMIDAQQVEVMKAQWEKSFTENKARTDQAYEAKITDLEGKVAEKDGSIKRMLIKGVIDTSKYLDSTIFGPLRDSAFLQFGNNFEVEAGDNGDFRVVAKLNGQPILSVARPGQLASPDEALEAMILAHPQKEHILKGSQASGGGATGGGSGSGGSKTTVDQLKEKYDAAVKSNDALGQVSLKRQIFEAEQAARTA